MGSNLVMSAYVGRFRFHFSVHTKYNHNGMNKIIQDASQQSGLFETYLGYFKVNKKILYISTHRIKPISSH